MHSLTRPVTQTLIHCRHINERHNPNTDSDDPCKSTTLNGPCRSTATKSAPTPPFNDTFTHEAKRKAAASKTSDYEYLRVNTFTRSKRTKTTPFDRGPYTCL